MAVQTLITALLLIVVGVVGYASATPNEEGKVSPTALIPAAIGGVLAICGLLAMNDKLRKHAMHFAAIVGLFGAVGGFMPFIRQYNKNGSIDPTAPASISGGLMILLCAVFVGLCVNSFIQAKKARKALAGKP